MSGSQMTNADVEALEKKLSSTPDDSGVKRKLLACLRARKMRRPDLVVRCAMPLLSGGGRGGLRVSEVWDVREQFYLACLDLHMFDQASAQLDELKAKFPGSVRVRGLQGMFLEAQAGSSECTKDASQQLYQGAMDLYNEIITDEPANAFARKRKACVMRGVGSPEGMVESVKLMNEYLELYPTDMDAWRELAELYLEMGHVEAAKTALEECVMLSPINYVSHTLLADALYTLGDFGTARKYYAQSLELNGAATNARAALGMVLCTTAINSKPKATAEEKINNLPLFLIGKSALLGSYTGLRGDQAGLEVGKLARAWLK